MADETVTSETQVVEGAEAQVAASNEEVNTPDTGKTVKEYEKLLKDLNAANAEAAKWRVEARTAKEALTAKEAAEAEAKVQADRATMSEVEKARAEKADAEEKARVKLEEYETKLRARETAIRESAFKSAAKEAKIVDPDAANRLLDWNRVEYDDKGHPTNVEVLLGELVKDRPWLIGTASTASVTNAPTREAKSGDRTVFRASEVSGEMWRTQRPVLMKAIAEGRWVED